MPNNPIKAMGYENDDLSPSKHAQNEIGISHFERNTATASSTYTPYPSRSKAQEKAVRICDASNRRWGPSRPRISRGHP